MAEGPPLSQLGPLWGRGWRPVAIAALTGAVVFTAGTGVESLIISALHGDRQRLEWISDVVLSIGFATMTYLWLHLHAARRRLSDLERRRIALDEQLRLAAEIQRSLLPEIPPATRGYRWAARMVPASEVGGDFYDFVRAADGAVLAVVGDVSGKGMPAALMQSSLKSLFRLVARDSQDPAAIATRMSQALYEQTAGLPYATAIVARFDASPPRLAFTNAGHPAGVLLRRNGGARSLGSGGMPLGLRPEASYEQEEVRLAPGDLGVLVTDGITEALEGASLTVADVLLETPDLVGGSPPAEICDSLLRTAGAAPGPVGVEGWRDDRTVLVFRVAAEA